MLNKIERIVQNYFSLPIVSKDKSVVLSQDNENNIFTIKAVTRKQRVKLRDTLVKKGIPAGCITFVNYYNEYKPFKFAWHLKVYY